MKNKRNIQHHTEALNKSGVWNNPVVTTLEPITKFYQADGYRLNYFDNNG
jgi:peptide-methionine (S)-S-oxide reductase